jgi:hypothetical protein
MAFTLTFGDGFNCDAEIQWRCFIKELLFQVCSDRYADQLLLAAMFGTGWRSQSCC